MLPRRRFVRQSLLVLAGSALALRCRHEPMSEPKAPALTLLAPLGGEQFDLSAAVAIRWASTSVERLDIQFTFNDGLTWQTLATGVDASSGQHLWTVPAQEYTQCRLRLQAVGLPDLFAESAPFSVRWQQVIRVANHGDLQAIGGSKIFSSAVAGDFVVRRLSAANFQVISLYCTHNGCTVEWEAANQRYKCPCHFSVFDIKGCVLNGPALLPLHELRSEYDPVTDLLTVVNVVLPNAHSDC